MSNFSHSGKYQGITLILVTIVGLGVAVMLGRFVASGQNLLVALILGGVVGSLVLLRLNEKTWFFIPIAICFAYASIPLGSRLLSISEPLILVASGVFFIRYFMHVQRIIFMSRSEHVPVFLYFFWVVIIFCMNPTGFSFLGSDSGGARSYLNLVLALLSFIIIANQRISETDCKWVALIMVAASIFQPAWSLLSYTAFGFGGGDAESDLSLGGYAYTWHQTLAIPALTVSIFIFSKYKVERVFGLQHPIALLVWIFCVLVALISGKRALLMSTLLIPLIFAVIRKQYFIIFISSIFLALFLTILVAGHGNLFDLPYRAQRALSIFPGRWESEVTVEIEGNFRGKMRELAWKQFLDDPLFGRKGYNVNMDVVLDSLYGSLIYKGALFEELALQKLSMTGSWHNTWLGIAADFGLPGVLLYLFFTISALALAYRLYKQLESRDASWSFILVSMIFLELIIAVLRSWTTGHSTKIAFEQWWLYAILIAIKYSLISNSKDQTQLKESKIAPHRPVSSTKNIK